MVLLEQHCIISISTESIDSFLFSSLVLQAEGERAFVCHCGGEDHDASGDAWQRQHIRTQGISQNVQETALDYVQNSYFHTGISFLSLVWVVLVKKRNIMQGSASWGVGKSSYRYKKLTVVDALHKC